MSADNLPSSESRAPMRKGWERLPVEHLPRPTFWPAGLAFAVTFIIWGLITSWVISIVGVGLFLASLAGWIRHLRYERKHNS